MNNISVHIKRNIPKQEHQRSISFPSKKNYTNINENQLNKSNENRKIQNKNISRKLRVYSEKKGFSIDKIEVDILNLEKDNIYLSNRNMKFELFLEKLKEKNEILDSQIKELKENILNSLRLRNNLKIKINKLKNELELSQNGFKMFRNIKEFKLNIINKNIRQTKIFSVEKKKNFTKKIETELQNKYKIETTLETVRNNIKKRRRSLSDINDCQNKYLNKLCKERIDFEVFLNNL